MPSSRDKHRFMKGRMHHSKARHQIPLRHRRRTFLRVRVMLSPSQGLILPKDSRRWHSRDRMRRSPRASSLCSRKRPSNSSRCPACSPSRDR